MRYSSAIILGAAALVSASTSQHSVQSCFDGCNTGDLNCKAHCVPVPNPSDKQAMDTNHCVADCAQGDGNAKCRTGCIEQFYFKPGVGTPPKDGDGYKGGQDGNSNGNDGNNGSDNSDGQNDPNGNGNDNSNTWPWDTNNPATNDGDGTNDDGTGNTLPWDPTNPDSTGMAPNGGTPTNYVGPDETLGPDGTPTPTAAASGLLSSSAALFAVVAALFAL